MQDAPKHLPGYTMGSPRWTVRCSRKPCSARRNTALGAWRVAQLTDTAVQRAVAAPPSQAVAPQKDLTTLCTVKDLPARTTPPSSSPHPTRTPCDRHICWLVQPRRFICSNYAVRLPHCECKYDRNLSCSTECTSAETPEDTRKIKGCLSLLPPVYLFLEHRLRKPSRHGRQPHDHEEFRTAWQPGHLGTVAHRAAGWRGRAALAGQHRPESRDEEPKLTSSFFVDLLWTY